MKFIKKTLKTIKHCGISALVALIVCFITELFIIQEQFAVGVITGFVYLATFVLITEYKEFKNK